MHTQTIDALVRGASALSLIGVIVAFIFGFVYAWWKRASAQQYLDKSRQTLQLADRVVVSPNTYRFRFALPSSSYYIGLPAGKHVHFFLSSWAKGKVPGQWNGAPDKEEGKSEIVRKYTPVTGDEFCGFVDFVVKIYRPDEEAGFPDGGRMTRYLESLDIGDFIDICGPFGLLTFYGCGRLTYGRRELINKTKISMIAGGSGITPMLQIIKVVLASQKSRVDPTVISLLYANQTEDDILLRDILEEYAEHHPKQFSLWYTIDRPSVGGTPKLCTTDPEGHSKPELSATSVAVPWKYSVGFVNAEMVKEHLFPPSDDGVVLICGPPRMSEDTCRPILEKLGYRDEDVLVF